MGQAAGSRTGLGSVTMRATPGWQVDEMATIGRENLDAAHVAGYDAKQDSHAASEVDLLVGLGLDRTSVVVDLGAGTGQFALAAARRFGRVVAVDPSPVMVEALRANVARHRPDRTGAEPVTGSHGSRVEVVEAGFLTYEHHGTRPDAVYSRWALHHLPDFWKSVALHRIRRLLSPGGLLRLADVAYSFPPGEAVERIEAWAAAVDADTTDWIRADVEDHVRDEHSTYTWLLEPLLEAAGFEITDARYSPDGFLAEYVLTAR